MKIVLVENKKYNEIDWINWVAQDPNGSWWGYEVRPFFNRYETGWVARHGRAALLSLGDEPADWKATLRKV